MRLLTILFILFSFISNAQNIDLKKTFKFSTFYAAVNGGNSISDVDVYSVTNGLETQTGETPYDYAITLGIRKIARFGYENKANTFYDGTESNYSDAATVGKIRGLEYKFQFDIKRQEGDKYLDQHHFIPVSYTHLRAHETSLHLVCRLLLEYLSLIHI